MSLRKLFVCGALLAQVGLQATPPQPYTYIQTMPYTPYFVQDAYLLYSFVQNNSSGVIVDVGSHDGGVARYLAQQASALTSIREVYSISPWYSADPSQKHLYQRFLSNVVQENTASLITPIRMYSLEAAESFNHQADLIFVTGGNDNVGVYNDIIAWYPHLSSTGILCGNNWNEPSVQMGVTRAAAALEVTVKLADNVWYFQRSGQ